MVFPERELVFVEDPGFPGWMPHVTKNQKAPFLTADHLLTHERTRAAPRFLCPSSVPVLGHVCTEPQGCPFPASELDQEFLGEGLLYEVFLLSESLAGLQEVGTD